MTILQDYATIFSTVKQVLVKYQNIASSSLFTIKTRNSLSTDYIIDLLMTTV